MVVKPAPAEPKRIFMDATFTLASGKKSGIERVVCNLLRECKAICKAAGQQGEQVDGVGRLPSPQLIVSYAGKFFEVDERYLAECERLGAIHANIVASTNRFYRFGASLLCGLIRWSMLRKWLLPTSGHLGIFKLTHKWKSARSMRLLVRRQTPIEAQPGDLIVLPDAYWVSRLRHSVWPAAEEARQHGAFVVTLLYDLIPLTHPEFVGQRRRDSFLDYFTKAATHSDLLLAISKTVRDQVRQFLPSLSTEDDTFCSDVRSFTLGAELSVSTGLVRPAVRAAFEQSPAPYLMVATFDPRKNHAYLLDTFEQLWQRGLDISLCFVGRIGARCEEIVSRIREHAQLGRRLFLFDDLNDAELQHCYRHTRAVVFPSIVEGFGLPIVESLWFGKKTFASDTPIHREVGEDDCVYFQLSSTEALSHQIEQWEMDLANNIVTPQSARTPTDWHGSALELLHQCLDAMRVSAQSSAIDESHTRAA